MGCGMKCPGRGRRSREPRKEGAKTNPTSLPDISEVLRAVSDASAETKPLKPILSMGPRKRGDGAAGDAFIYIHICAPWNIIKTFPSPLGSGLGFLQLSGAALAFLALVCAGKLLGDRTESSEITWGRRCLQPLPVFSDATKCNNVVS